MGLSPLGAPFLAFALSIAACSAAAEDAVTVVNQRGGQTTVRGQIVDYTGASLRLILSDGRERTFPADKVLRVQTEYSPEQTQADAARAQGRFDQALVLYQQALKAERRRWVRRRILIEMIWCYRGLGRMVPAAETFLLLMRDNPSEADFTCIPLAWTPSRPSPELEQAARRWIARSDLPAAELLGASHLLSIDRPTALGISSVRWFKPTAPWRN